MDIAKIEDRIDRTAVTGIEISDALGGVRFSNMAEVMEMAKMLSISKEAVPKHLRGEPGICLAICVQALEWRFSPYAVANKSYVVNDRLAYESQLVHAVIESRAPIKGRLRHRYEGEGDERICIIWGTPRGEQEPLEYRSPAFGKITPKNSPLWRTKPDVQLYYSASRDWARIYFPDVLLGVFSKEELEGAEVEVTPSSSSLGDRLRKQPKKANDEGFGTKVIEHQISEVVPNPTPDKAQQGEKVPVVVGVAPQGLAPDTEPSPPPVTMEALRAAVEKENRERGRGAEPDPEPQPEPPKPKRTRAPKAAAPVPEPKVADAPPAADPLAEPVREMVREPVKEETAMERGLRLLPMTRTRADVTDLMYTIEEELGAAETAAWRVACKNRTAML